MELQMQQQIKLKKNKEKKRCVCIFRDVTTLGQGWTWAHCQR